MQHEFVLDPDLVHLNHAGVGPWPKRCADAVAAFAQTNARRSYAAKFPEWMATETRLRERIARLINAASPDDVALLKNTSEGLSQVAHGLSWQQGDRVVVLAEEFISNLITWEALAIHGVETVQVMPSSGQSPEDAIEAACDDRTRLLTVSSVQYGTGWRMDLERLGRFCSERDILFCVDAIQSLGALRFDAVACHADFVVSGAHKWLMSPFGIALFYCRPALREHLRPLAFGWHTVADPMRFHGTLSEIEPSARRFEAGTANLAAIMGFEATLGLLEEVGYERIERQVLANATYLRDTLLEHPMVTMISPRGDVGMSGNVCIRVRDRDLAQMAKVLEDDYGVLCAARGPSLRFSPHFYTSRQNLDSALAAIIEVIERP